MSIATNTFYMTLTGFLGNILFVIVLYRRRPEQSEAFRALGEAQERAETCLSFFLYDNSPDPCTPFESKNFRYRHDPLNSGVSKAYNEAAREAQKQNKKWMLLLDQDMSFPFLFLEKLYEAVMHYPDDVAFVPVLRDASGILSPFRWQWGGGKRIPVKRPVLPLRTHCFVNSGLLIACDAFTAAGGYEETIPLDFSDIAFAEKLKKIRPRFVVTDIVLEHSFSGTSKASLSETLKRYRFYCKGALNMGKTFGSYPVYYIRALLRGIRLSMIFRTTLFMKDFFRFRA